MARLHTSTLRRTVATSARRPRIAAVIALGVIIAAALIAFQSPRAAEATSFRPASPLTLYPERGVECSNGVDDNGNGVVNEGCGGANPAATGRVGPGTTPNTQSQFDIPSPNANFGNGFAMSFTDPEWTVALGGSGGAMALGAITGDVDAVATLGLTNSHCGLSVLNVQFEMMNASTNVNDTIDADGPPDNLLLPLAEDSDNDNLADGVNKYPSFLNTMFDPDGPGGSPPITPRARYMGVQDVVGLIVLLNLVWFEPGDMQAIPEGAGADASLGYTFVGVLQNPVQAASKSAISDFCTPLTTNFNDEGVSNDNACTTGGTPPAACSTNVATALGEREVFRGVDGGDTNSTTPGEAGVARLTAPSSAQTTVNLLVGESQRDFDGDGIENNLDPCHSSDSGAWDPRSATNPTTDSDGDGLDSSCDPSPGSPASDHDDDEYVNRLDLCPLVKDGDTTISDTTGGTVGDEFVTVANTAGFAVGNDILVGTGNSAERRTIASISPTGVNGRFNFPGSPLANSHLVGTIVAQIFVSNVNFGQSDFDIPAPNPVPDGGPRNDAIGPACDTGVTIAGEPLNASIPNGHFHRTTRIARTCVLGTDADNDSVCDDIDPNESSTDTDGDGELDRVDNCMSVANPPPAGLGQADADADGIGDACDTFNDNDGDGFSNTLEALGGPCGNASDDDSDGRVNDGCPAWGAAETNCTDSVDSDRDLFINDGCPTVSGTPEVNSVLHTSPEIACARNSQDTVGSYPPDINGDTSITSADLSLVAGPIGTSTVAGGGAANDRVDLAPEPASDNSITSADLSAVAAVIGTGC